MKKYIRKADIILFIVLVAVGLAASAALALRGDIAGDKVIIESGGDLYATYPLAEDRTVIVPAPKQIKIDAPEAGHEEAGGRNDDVGSDSAGDAAGNDDADGENAKTGVGNENDCAGNAGAATGKNDVDGGEKNAAHASSKFDYYNIVEIKDGKVSVIEASCKNQVCVKHSPVSRSGESIVCLPNRLVVRIDSGITGKDKNDGSGKDAYDKEKGGSDDSGEGEGYDTVTS